MCILGKASAEAERSFQKVLAAYKAHSGHEPYVVTGSSAGALAFGSVELADVRKGSQQLDTASVSAKKRQRR